MMYEKEDLPKHWAKLAYFNNTIVGAICCQLVEEEDEENNDEDHSNENIFEDDLNDSTQNGNSGCYELAMKASTSSSDVHLSPKLRHVCILTLASLPTFRRRGVASLLLKKLIEWVQKHAETIRSIYLHVQVNNQVAMEFYKKFDFKLIKKVDNYYKRIQPSGAYLLERKIFV